MLKKRVKTMISRLLIIALCLVPMNISVITHALSAPKEANEFLIPATTPAVNGLLAEYYEKNGNGFSFGKHMATKIDSNIDFENLDPVLAVWIGRQDKATIRWSGQVTPKYSENYTFSMQGDDGYRLWIDNQLILEQLSYSGAEKNSAPITLQAGVPYTIKVEFFENSGGSKLELRWSSPSDPKEIVPTTAFTLPVNYTGPVAGEITKDGLTVELDFNEDLLTLSGDLQQHLNCVSEIRTCR